MGFKHLKIHGVSYFSHMGSALSFFFLCVVWTLEVLVHAFIPDLFTETSLKMKREIQRRTRKDARAQALQRKRKQ